MVANLAPAPVQHHGAYPELTAGAMLLIKTAHMYANQSGVTVTSPSCLLVAILEHPSRRIRDYLQSQRVSLDWIADAAVGGLGQSPLKGDPDIDAITETATELADEDGQFQVDDFYLLLALQQKGDRFTSRLFREAGLAKPEEAVTTSPHSGKSAQNLNIAGQNLSFPQPATAVEPVQFVQKGKTRRRLLIQKSSFSPLFLGIILLGFACLVGLQMFPEDNQIRVLTIGFVLATWLASLCVHEYGHAAAAFMYGDQSVVQNGYLSFDLRKYTGSLISFGLPLFFLLMGGIPLPGGRVLLNPAALKTARSRRRVALAGPMGNAIFFVALSLPLIGGVDQNSPIGVALAAAAYLQAFAITFNLLPLPPLDGWRIISAGMPEVRRLKAAGMGWYPMIVFVMAMNAIPIVATIVVLPGLILALIFQVDTDAAIEGLKLLSLR